jgi:ubiquinone/menaquinone biosynthesis C-methylase UbiE/thiamine kinase-like enzyme
MGDSALITNSKFYCPSCKSCLENKNDKLLCHDCGELFSYKNGYADFINGKNYEIENDIAKEKLCQLLSQIDQYGYKKVSLDFLNDPEVKPHLTDVKSADPIFHCIGKNNLRCLEIGSNLGKVSENLSHIFHEVYSIETNREKIEFQKKRFQDLDISNIILLSCNPTKIPFPDNYFDLIVCNGIFELCKIFNPDCESKNAQDKFLKEMKRVLAEKGCFCLGIQNKFGLSRLFGMNEPNNRKEKKKLVSLYSLFGYQKILNEVGFNFKAYWVLPSYKKPYFSGNLEDKITLQWFFQNITRFRLIEKRSRIKSLAILIIKKFNKDALGIIIKIFVPSFIFCCYKNSNIESIEDVIKQQTRINNFLTLGRRTRIINILLDKKGIPTKLVSLERYGYKIPEKIVECNRIFPNMQNPKDRLWMEDWIKGETLDRSKINELSIAINWLLKFQNNTTQDIMTKKFVQETETSWIKVGLSEIKILDLTQWDDWLNEYESYVDKNIINKTAVHGDFWYSNILNDSESHEINVVDWENFQKEGNPFFDIIIFIFQFMIMDSNNKVKAFQSNFIQTKKIELLKKWQERLSEHFGFEFKLIVLLRWFLMREIAYSKLFVNGERVNAYVEMLKFLSDKESFFYIV